MAFDLDVQTAIFTQLSGLPTAVYDSPPTSAAYPYIVIGNDTSIPFDTDDTVGRDFIVNIHIWDNYNGYKRIKEIFGQIDDILNRGNFAVPNHDLIDCIFDSSDFFFDSDGKTRHAVVSYRLLIDEA